MPSQKAHAQLVEALRLAPDEPALHLELAKSYMQLGKGEFATLTTAPAAGAGHQFRAKGSATLPSQFAELVSHHLCAAIDLDPRLARQIKAMGEGARAALRGSANRYADGAAGDETYRREDDDESAMYADEEQPSGITGQQSMTQEEDDDMGDSFDASSHIDEDEEEDAGRSETASVVHIPVIGEDTDMSIE